MSEPRFRTPLEHPRGDRPSEMGRRVPGLPGPTSLMHAWSLELTCPTRRPDSGRRVTSGDFQLERGRRSTRADQVATGRATGDASAPSTAAWATWRIQSRAPATVPEA